MKRRLTVTLLVEALLALGASTAGYVLFRYVYHALTQGGGPSTCCLCWWPPCPSPCR